MSSSLLANQCLTSLKPELIGTEDTPRINKSGTGNTACLKRGYTYGNKLYDYARNLCSIYNISICRDESCCFMRHKHLAFQCEYNDDATLTSYAKRNYDLIMQSK